MIKILKIIEDSGHGGFDGGAIHKSLKEKDLTLRIGKKVVKLLKQYEGVKVKSIRTTDKTVSLKERTDIANKWGADLYLSIHINAGGGTGFESFIFSNLSDSSRTKKIQKSIHESIIKETKVNDRGMKKANFHVLRETKMDAILTENLFIDNSKDYELLSDDKFLDKIALGHVKGISSFYGLKKKKSTSNTVSKKPSNTSSTKNITSMANEVRKGLHGNGHENRRKSLGISKSEYEKVRKKVNELEQGKKPSSVNINSIVNRIINNTKVPKGHEARRKYFGLSKTDYEKVRKEVNRRLK